MTTNLYNPDWFYRNFSFFVISLITICLQISCATKPPIVEPLEEEGVAYSCDGTFSGHVIYGEERTAIRIFELQPAMLGDCALDDPSRFPYCLLIYLDADEDPAADYCFLVNSEQWVLKKESAPNYFSKEIARGTVSALPQPAGLFFELDTALLPQPVKRVWNFRAVGR